MAEDKSKEDSEKDEIKEAKELREKTADKITDFFNESADEKVEYDQLAALIASLNGSSPAFVESLKGLQASVAGVGLSKLQVLEATKLLMLALGNEKSVSSVLPAALNFMAVGATRYNESKEDLEKDLSAVLTEAQARGISDPAGLQKEFDLIGRIRALSGNEIGAQTVSTFVSSLGELGEHLTDKQIVEFLPLIEKLGGDKAGSALKNSIDALVGSGLSGSRADAAIGYGLVDQKHNEEALKQIYGAKWTQHRHTITAGSVIGSEVLKEDPKRWLDEYLLPALAKKGITRPEDIQNALRNFMPDGDSARVMGLLVDERKEAAEKVEAVNARPDNRAQVADMKKAGLFDDAELKARESNTKLLAADSFSWAHVAIQKAEISALSFLDGGMEAHPVVSAVLGTIVAGGAYGYLANGLWDKAKLMPKGLRLPFSKAVPEVLAEAEKGGEVTEDLSYLLGGTGRGIKGAKAATEAEGLLARILPGVSTAVKSVCVEGVAAVTAGLETAGTALVAVLASPVGLIATGATVLGGLGYYIGNKYVGDWLYNRLNGKDQQHLDSRQTLGEVLDVAKKQGKKVDNHYIAGLVAKDPSLMADLTNEQKAALGPEIQQNVDRLRQQRAAVATAVPAQAKTAAIEPKSLDMVLQSIANNVPKTNEDLLAIKEELVQLRRDFVAVANRNVVMSVDGREIGRVVANVWGREFQRPAISASSVDMGRQAIPTSYGGRR